MQVAGVVGYGGYRGRSTLDAPLVRIVDRGKPIWRSARTREHCGSAGPPRGKAVSLFLYRQHGGRGVQNCRKEGGDGGGSGGGGGGGDGGDAANGGATSGGSGGGMSAASGASPVAAASAAAGAAASAAASAGGVPSPAPRPCKVVEGSVHGHFWAGGSGSWGAKFSGAQSAAVDDKVAAVLGRLAPAPAPALAPASGASSASLPARGFSALELDYGLGVSWKPRPGRFGAAPLPQSPPEPEPPSPQPQPLRTPPRTTAERPAWAPQAFTGGGGLTASSLRRHAFTLQFSPALVGPYLEDHTKVGLS